MRHNRLLAQFAKKSLGTLLEADYCPLYLHWSPGSKPNTGQQLRRWASHYQTSGNKPLLRWLFWLALVVSWPLRLLWLVGRNLYKFAPVIRHRTGKAIWRQGLEQLWLAFTHALPPDAYYRYEFYRPAARPLVDQYIHQHEIGSLLPYLNRYQRHPAIDDKAQFYLLCRQQGVPTAPVLAVCRQGRVTWQAQPCGDLFIKPVTGARGEGAMLWQQTGDGGYQDEQRKTITHAELVALLEKLSRQRDYLVQPRLLNHPALFNLSGGELLTARILTGRRPTGDVEAIAATLKMAWKASIISTHGLNSPIDLATGQLGRAHSYSPISKGFDQHPATEAQISGRVVPDWQQALDLAQQAHQHFPCYVFLGWDVALTTQGPLLLEGNAGWDVISVQKPQGIPLAQTRFAAICREWLAQIGNEANKL